MSCSGPIGAHDPVAVVQLHVAAGQPPHAVLRDYADVAHPRTVCELGAYGFDLIDARHGLIPGPAGAIVDLPELRFHWFTLPATPGYAPGLIAISPALDQIVWSTTDPEGTATDTIHLTTATGDRVLATLRDTNTGRCSSPDDSRPGGFTPSGKHAYVLNQPLQQQASLLVVEAGKVVFSVLPPAGKDWPENAWPAMAVWSPTAETLYYRQGTDIWKWSSGSGAQKFLPGVKWFYPTISPDGRWLAYAVEIPNFLHDVYVVDLAHGGTPQKIGPGAHNYPVFLNDSQLWLMAESLYTGCADNTELKPMVYNVVSRTEAPSIIDWVDSAWPATSSNW